MQPDDQPEQPAPEQPVQASLAARVPDHVSSGLFATGAIVLDGPGEFVIDFIQSVIRPPRIVRRIVMIPPVFNQFIEAFRENMRIYERNFGPPKPMPRPLTPPKQPTIQDIYDELKLPDSELAGVYANAVMISHSPAEFAFDFIARFIPRAAVSARIFLSASHAPGVLETLAGSFGHWLRKTQQQKQQPAPHDPAGPSPQDPMPPPGPAPA